MHIILFIERKLLSLMNKMYEDKPIKNEVKYTKMFFSKSILHKKETKKNIATII
jgi:hypothetical protein